VPQSPQQIADSASQLDRFAELLSLNLETPEIAERMAIPRVRASQLLGKLRQKYGWQAQ
jgi:DNA-binding transcriptional regulator LsrR (DeoR family)